MYSILLKIFILFFTDIWVASVPQSLNAYYLSKIHLLFAFVLTVLTSIKYNFFKILEKRDDKYRYLKSYVGIIAIFLLVDLIYIILPNYLDIHYYSTEEYLENSYCYSVLDILFLPHFLNTLDVVKMTLIEACFSLIFVTLAFSREKLKYGKVAYILHSVIKHIYRYNFLFIFLIYISTIHNKFIFARNVKYALSIIVAFSLCYVLVKSYLSLIGINKLNKNKEKQKNNLIVVMTPKNYKFRLSDYIFSPMRRFYRYDNKNIVKNLFVEGKEYSFVSFDAILYRLIDLKKFKNISYCIIMSDANEFNEFDEREYVKQIDKIVDSKNNYIICFSSFMYMTTEAFENLREKYSFRVKANYKLKDILDMTGLTKEADTLKINSKKLLDYILESEKEKETKNEYLKYGLSAILNSFSYTEYFYTILKMCEYVIHYIGLKDLILTEEKKKEDVIAVENSTWRFLIKQNRKYSKENNARMCDIASEENICVSLNNLRRYLCAYSNKECKEDREEIFFKEDICDIVGKIRNIIVAHGSVSENIAKSLTADLFIILFALVKEFEELDITIDEDEKIKDIFKKDINAVYKYSDKMFLYSNPVIKKKQVMYNECLNYETGRKKVIDGKIVVPMDKIYSKEEVESELSEWVIRK